MRILVAEDERGMSSALVAVLEHNGYDVDTAFDGEEAVEKASASAYDCMVFDIMMPKLDGVQAVERIRQSGDVTSVIFLTAKAEVSDRITGLDAGADDYLTKPFSMAELLARIRAMTRRSTTFTPKELTHGSVTLNVAEQELKCTNSVRLSPQETKLMELFMLNDDKELHTDDIFRRIWKEDDDKQIVFIYISYLREKLASIEADVTIAGEQGGVYWLESV